MKGELRDMTSYHSIRGMVRAEGAKCVEGSFRQPKSFDQETQILSSGRRTEPPKMTPTEVAPPDRRLKRRSAPGNGHTGHLSWGRLGSILILNENGRSFWDWAKLSKTCKEKLGSSRLALAPNCTYEIIIPLHQLVL